MERWRTAPVFRVDGLVLRRLRRAPPIVDRLSCAAVRPCWRNDRSARRAGAGWSHGANPDLSFSRLEGRVRCWRWWRRSVRSQLRPRSRRRPSAPTTRWACSCRRCRPDSVCDVVEPASCAPEGTPATAAGASGAEDGRSGAGPVERRRRRVPCSGSAGYGATMSPAAVEVGMLHLVSSACPPGLLRMAGEAPNPSTWCCTEPRPPCSPPTSDPGLMDHVLTTLLSGRCGLDCRLPGS